MPATASTIRIIGDWQKQIKQGLDNVLSVSMDVMGRNGDEACKHAMILSAESARAITMKAKKNRQVFKDWARPARYKRTDSSFDYVKIYHQGQSEPVRLFKWKAKTMGEGVWENAKKIPHVGLAKRSWMWGLNAIGGHSESYPIAGTSRFYSLLGNKVCGYVKENRLGYILKAMPAGWEIAVQTAVENKIMKQAVIKLQNEWRSHVNRAGGWYGAPPTEKQLSSFFLRAA